MWRNILTLAFAAGANAQDYNCEMKEVSLECTQIDFIDSYQCHISVAYTPCDLSQFSCVYHEMTTEGLQEDDCTEDFANPEFWCMLSQERFWQEEEYAQN